MIEGGALWCPVGGKNPLRGEVNRAAHQVGGIVLGHGAVTRQMQGVGEMRQCAEMRERTTISGVKAVMPKAIETVGGRSAIIPAE